MTTEKIKAAKERLEIMIDALTFDNGMCSQAAMAVILLQVLENQDILARDVARLGMDKQ